MGNTESIENLQSVYDNADQLDLLIWALYEEDLLGPMVGETYQHILVDQFVRLRDGDRI
ncbi:MAG: peroxidase family protein [Akkermansiaceae bacterium]